jgi:cell division protein FtsL
MAQGKAGKGGGKREGGTLRMILVVAMLTLVALFFVWTRNQNIRLRLDNKRLKQREQEALIDNNRLKLEWARLVSPKRLEDLGKEKYNLSRPRPEQVIVLTEPKDL